MLCAQAGHWTYECKNPPSYTARPTRTQQLLNPKVRLGPEVLRTPKLAVASWGRFVCGWGKARGKARVTGSWLFLQARPRFLDPSELLPEARGAAAGGEDDKKKGSKKRKKREASSSDSDSSSSSSDSDDSSSSSSDSDSHDSSSSSGAS